ncbi:MAG TPA: hypothetical protein VFV07_07505 [Rhizomicrobium sp.]|nr:hypothetical protein [Rhizomicrobium sp.]
MRLDVRHIVNIGLGAVFAAGLAWNMVEVLKYQMKYGFFTRGQETFTPLYLMMGVAFVAMLVNAKW